MYNTGNQISSRGIPPNPGWVMSVVRAGVSPFFHTQDGSPNSSPLDLKGKSG